MPKPHRRIPPAEVERQQAVREVLDANLGYADEVVDAWTPEVRQAVAATVRTARRALPPEGGRMFRGPFNMIDVDEYNIVFAKILKLPHSKRRNDVLAIFGKLIGYIRRGEGEITLSRKQFADECGILPRHVSTVMTTLEELKVIRREFCRGTVTYYVNSNLIWNGDRERQQAEAAKMPRPSLHVVEGGVP